ncbi:MAG: YicC/YloC family endoribonuclease [Myxococcota bacterium]
MSRGLHSMTGFGRGEAAIGGARVGAEVRCVNSRHLDLRLRLPRELAALEAPLRAEVASYFARGSVEVAIRLPAEVESGPRFEVDRLLAARYRDSIRALISELDLAGGLDAATLLALPGVVRQLEAEPAGEALAAAVSEAVHAACQQAREMRSREGAALRSELEARLEELRAHLRSLEESAREIAKALRERLLRRVAQLAPEVEFDRGRLDQEIVLLADRQDITEELVRLESHLDQFSAALAEPSPVGRKLEFLLQEIAREVNTAGSKAQVAKISTRVVDLKTDLEKIREQVLNVE